MTNQVIAQENATGRLWWCADNMDEAKAMERGLLTAGAVDVVIQPDMTRDVVDVLITLNRATADQVVGYEIEPCEWLEE